jgi:hypothetical protein
VSRRGLAFAAALAALLATTGCGSGESVTATPSTEDLTMSRLSASVEGEAAGFLDRRGTALHGSLERFLGGTIATRLDKGSTECRPGAATASITDARRYPFACVVEGSADGRGLTVNITLGFVGLELDGRCWRAANERVAVTTGAPALLPRREAMRPVNRIAGCA